MPPLNQKTQFMKPLNFLALLTLLLFISGCDNEFIDVELTTSDCYSQFPTIDYYSGQHGTIMGASLNDVPNLIVIGDLDKNGYYLFPCNLPAKYQLNGTEIIFDAEIKELPTSRCDTCVQLEYTGTPVTLTALKVKELF